MVRLLSSCSGYLSLNLKTLFRKKRLEVRRRKRRKKNIRSQRSISIRR